MRNLLRGNKLVMVFVSFRWNHHHLGFQLIENRRTITDSVIRLSTLETTVGFLLIAVDHAMVFSLANNAWLEFARSSIEWARRLRCPMIEAGIDKSFVVVVSFVVGNRAALVVVGMDSPDDVLRLSSIPDWIDMSLPMLIRVVGSVVESSLIPYS